MKKILTYIVVPIIVAVVSACSSRQGSGESVVEPDAVLVSEFGDSELDTLNIMLHWTPQAQFAGYYMALEKGFYKEEGIALNLVSMLHASEGDALKNLQSGKVDMCSSLLQHAMLERSWGSDIVNVLQTSQNSGLMLVSHKPINNLKELERMKVGRWKQGFGEIADIFYHENGLDVHPIDFTQGVNLYLCGAFDATLCYSYNEYIEVVFAEGMPDRSSTMRFSDLGYNWPEDGVFTTSWFYEQNKDLVERFNRATVKGWNYARDHREEAVDVVVSTMRENLVPCSPVFQRMMLDEILDLQIDKVSGTATFAPVSEPVFRKMNSLLLSMGYLSEIIDYKDFVR